MKIIDKYIAKKFLVTVIYMFVITAAISIIFDVSEKMGDFLNNKVPLHVILFDYYIAFIPNIINIVSPLVIFLSALYFTSRIANNTEILAILASGTSYTRILVPYIGVAVLIAGVDLGMKNFIIPRSFAKQIKFETMYIDRKYSFEAKNIHRQLDKNSYFYAQAIDYSDKRAYRFTIEKFNGQQLTYKMRAAEAYYDSTSNTWMVRSYVERQIDGLHETLKTGDSIRLKLPITMRDFSQKIKSIPSMTTPELSQFIKDEKFKGEDLTNFYLVEMYKRFSMPVDIIVLVLIAVSLSTRKVRGGIGMHLLLGILIAVTQVMFVRFSTTFATNGNFPPLLAVFLPTIVFGILAFYLIRVTPK